MGAIWGGAMDVASNRDVVNEAAAGAAAAAVAEWHHAVRYTCDHSCGNAF